MGNVELSVFIESSLVYDILIHIREQKEWNETTNDVLLDIARE